MSDASDPSASPVRSDGDPNPSSPGAWLKRERERRGLTIQRIAADMHLSVAAVEAIEASRFAVLGAPVFAKGHLRKYASLLDLPVAQVIELYDRLEDAPRAVDPVPSAQRAPEPALRPAIRELLSLGPDSKLRRPQIWPWAAAVAATLALAMLAWWSFGHRKQPEAQTKAELPVAVTERVQPATTSTATTQSVETSSPPATISPSPAPVPTISPARSARLAGSPPPGKVRIRLTFARDSWVEVYDVDGNRMLYDVGRVDLPRMIDVAPPALVVLGDASVVTTEANDSVISIPKKNISGTVARFTIVADGSVR